MLQSLAGSIRRQVLFKKQEYWNAGSGLTQILVFCLDPLQKETESDFGSSIHLKIGNYRGRWEMSR